MHWITWHWILAVFCIRIHCVPLLSSTFEDDHGHLQSSYFTDVSSSYFEIDSETSASTPHLRMRSSVDFIVSESSADFFYSNDESVIYSSLTDIQPLTSSTLRRNFIDSSDSLEPIVVQLASSLLGDNSFRPYGGLINPSLTFEVRPSSLSINSEELNTPQWFPDSVSSIVDDVLKDGSSYEFPSTSALRDTISKKPESNRLSSVVTPSLPPFRDEIKSSSLKTVSSSLPSSGLVTTFRPFLSSPVNYKKSPEYKPSSSSDIAEVFQYSFVTSNLVLFSEDELSTLSSISSTRVTPSLVRTFRPSILRIRPSSSVSHQQPSITSPLLSQNFANYDDLSRTSSSTLVTAFRPTDLRIRPSSVSGNPSSVASLVSSSSSFHDVGALASSFFGIILPSRSSQIPSEPVRTLLTSDSVKVSNSPLFSASVPTKSTPLHNDITASLLSNSENVRPTSSLILLPTADNLSVSQPPLSPVIQVEDFAPPKPSDSTATVDKIIEDLMNIIRPLNSQIHPSSSPQPESAILPASDATNNPFIYVTDIRPSISLPSFNVFQSKVTIYDKGVLSSSKLSAVAAASTPVYSIEPTISSHVFPLFDSTLPVFKDQQVAEIQGVLMKDEPTTTPRNTEVNSVQDGDNVADGVRPEFSYFYIATEPNVSITTHSKPVSIVSTNLFPARHPVNKKPVLTRTPVRKPALQTQPTFKPSRNPTTFFSTPSTTTNSPPFFAFGEARPILLDLFGDSQILEEKEDSRLPSTSNEHQHVPNHNLETVVGSTVVKLKGPSSTSKPVLRPKPSLQSVSSHFDYDSLLTTSTTSVRPLVGHQALQPSTIETINALPSELPLQTVTPLIFGNVQSVDGGYSNVISTQSSVVIRPTPASSSVVRQTIFHTVVSISDSASSDNFDEFAHFDDSDSPSQSDVVNVQSLGASESSSASGLVEHIGQDQTSSATTPSSVTVTTTTPATSKTTTTRRLHGAVTSSKKPGLSSLRPYTKVVPPSTTKRSILRRTTTTRSRTTSKSPVFKPVRTTRRPFSKRRPTTTKPQSNPITTTTRRPFRPAQALLNIGYTLLPVAVIASVIGLPLAIAGRKKRDVVQNSDPTEMWQKILEAIQEMSDKWEN